MKFTLKDYQAEAVQDSLSNLETARNNLRIGNDKLAFSLTAVTGAGKTVMAAAVLEALFHGDDELDFDSDPGAVVIWFSDDPSLNEQTRFRLLESSDRISHSSMVVVENTFHQPKFEPGHIYFLNTQKLSKSSLLVRGHESLYEDDELHWLYPGARPDARAYTIWDTIRNTIEDPELNLYLILDEAHRGMGRTSSDRSTIVQRLINGHSDIPAIPVVMGISATVERFESAMKDAKGRTKLPAVVVDSTRVQESGLIKDTILLDIPVGAGDFDTVLVRRGATKLREVTALWAKYAAKQEAVSRVVPLMVLQVPNKPDPDDVGRAIEAVIDCYPELSASNFAHVFGEHVTQRFGAYDVPYIEPQRVQESEWVRVLIAKDAISTGWDCPRAEIMVSFRPASDRTHITQLLGRMIRSPLARRIPGDDRLNSVECLLPKFDRRTVEGVVNMLMTGDEFTASVGRVLVNPVEMRPNPTVAAEVWDKFESLPSQSRPVRGAKPGVRLTAAAQELSADGLVDGAGAIAHAVLHGAIDSFRAEHPKKISAKRAEVVEVRGQTLTADLRSNSKTFDQFVEEADRAAIDEVYRRATRIFTPDVSRTYVDYLASKTANRDEEPEAYLDAVREARVTVAGLGLVVEIGSHFDQVADRQTNVWLEQFRETIESLPDDRKEAYRQIIELSPEPQNFRLARPESTFEPTTIRLGSQETALPTWQNHMLCDTNGEYPAELNNDERTVLEQEARGEGFIAWYRNPQYPGRSSLGIAYEDAGEYKIVRPDFIFFRAVGDRIVADLVDPHGTHLADALPKLQGLATYTEQNADLFERVESVAMAGGRLRKLNLKDGAVRQAVRQATDAASLFASTVADDY